MSVKMWDVLKSIGFVEDQSVISDPPGGLSFDFGICKVTAGFLVNTYFTEIVMLHSIMSDSDSISWLEDQLPREVESWEQGVALITYCLDKFALNGLFEPALPTKWLAEGRRNRHLLPWERERVAYEARPQCLVERDWAKIALRKLSELVEALADDVPVIFHFDGEILTIRCLTNVLAISASGKAWPSRYSLTAKQLRWLPKRLKYGDVIFSVWQSSFTIGNYRYRDVVALDIKGNGDKP